MEVVQTSEELLAGINKLKVLSRSQPRWALLLICLLVVACSGRSTEAFCDVYESESRRISEAMKSQGEAMDGEEPLADFFNAMALTLGTVGELEAMFARLSDVAPEEIRADTESVHEGIQRQVELLEEADSDPLAALVGSLASSLVNAPAQSRVNNYIGDHCENPFKN